MCTYCALNARTSPRSCMVARQKCAVCHVNKDENNAPRALCSEFCMFHWHGFTSAVRSCPLTHRVWKSSLRAHVIRPHSNLKQYELETPEPGVYIGNTRAGRMSPARSRSMSWGVPPPPPPPPRGFERPACSTTRSKNCGA